MAIVVLAGRRVDAPDAAVPRFPLGHIEAVRAQIRAFLRQHAATVVVASGACGADLLALQAAEDEHIDRRIVLPFARKRFRELSVTDRPGEWGPLFDRVYQAARKESLGIKTLPGTANRDHDFVRTNKYLIKEAQKLAKSLSQPDILAVIVWDGVSRGPDDMTAGFATLAGEVGIPLHTISTIV